MLLAEAERNRIARIEVVIAAYVNGVAIVRSALRIDVVIDRARQVGQRNHGVEPERHGWTDAICGNLVVRERLADYGCAVSGENPGLRVVKLLCQTGEVTASLRREWKTTDVVLTAAFTVAFPIEEPEGFVAAMVELREYDRLSLIHI